MQRITVTIDDDLLEVIDRISEQRGYASRSEALRDLVRDATTRELAAADGKTPCYATLTYVYEHETRDLSRRLTSSQHHHHDLSVSTLHVHVDNQDCLEVAVLKGSVAEVKSFADSVVTQRGVRFGNLHIIPSEPAADGNDASHGHHHS
ncbi:nickel-responsive transcriptional regulator NikR [Rhizobium sp. BK251]|uniref:nickel-responsive transcriptional regulator NikR n=1 Tax=Rhizobium sp. BK251 TaxID=2512125 RepID=UPI00104EFB1F|nr:nickel-responsive transcriptional regulator NikR [Rhizobium sp. BK251]TCL68426.1 CopG family transcriptional regulator [Rhizobium sp. BK251]